MRDVGNRFDFFLKQAMLELTANLWAFLDADTGAIYALPARAYVLDGDDDSKLAKYSDKLDQVLSAR